jgi:hypothetical protein
MPAGLHDVSDDGFLAQLLARLQTMQPFHQDETFAVLPHQDRALQAGFIAGLVLSSAIAPFQFPPGTN